MLIDAKPSVRKQILRELQIMHDCHSDHIISFYGAFVSDPNICICMEYMDKGSLDGIYKKHGAIDIDIVGKIALAVLEGLTYLYDVHRIIHRGSSLRVLDRVRLIFLACTRQISSLPISSSTLRDRLRYVTLGCLVNSLILLPIPLLEPLHT